MAKIGTITEPTRRADALQRARHRASLLPELLVDTRQIVSTVMAGWHGRRKRGIGENFWQYRPYQQGETMARIDWRRSARDDQTYVRDLEWEAAHTVWVWVDPSPSLLYKSKGARVSKESRALVIALAATDLLSRAGERVGYPGLLRPVSTRNGAQRLATAFAAAPESTITDTPQLDVVQRHSDIIVISDFLKPVDESRKMLDDIVSRGARPHLVEIVDPAEEDFPYSGRTEFQDPVTGAKLTAGRAQDWQAEYRDIYAARRLLLQRIARSHGGSYTICRTDRLASETLVHLHGHMSGNPSTVVTVEPVGEFV